MCVYIVNKIERGMTYVSKSFVPQSPYTLAFGSFAWWYGKRLGETYAPGYISDYFINRTITYMGSETLGRTTGMMIVAPMFTPELAPLAAFAAGCVMCCIAILIGNLVHKLFSCCWNRNREDLDQQPKNLNTPTPV